jgi:hypothetical protein
MFKNLYNDQCRYDSSKLNENEDEDMLGLVDIVISHIDGWGFGSWPY